GEGDLIDGSAISSDSVFKLCFHDLGLLEVFIWWRLPDCLHLLCGDKLWTNEEIIKKLRERYCSYLRTKSLMHNA
ncbi:MAG: hypothetical protein PHR32_04925, partial [Candidatus Cloacimonetes bacterium]|nr:hypothetical protein [Candidatus Cloacimonadota bacterium]